MIEGSPALHWHNRPLPALDRVDSETLFPSVRDALDILAEAAERLRARDSGGPLTVSTLPSFAAKWLVPRMSRFQDRHPEIELRIAAGIWGQDLGT